MPHDSPVENVGILRLLFALLFSTLTFYFISGLFGNSLGEFEAFLPNPEKSNILVVGSNQNPGNDQWLEDFNQALLKAKETKKNIFVDISGEHCPNCRWMERNIFTLPEIQTAMNEMIKVKLITDVKKEPYISHKRFAQERFGIDAIPYYVIISPEDKVIAVETATRDKQKYLNFLLKGKR
jgi:thiol:disulfide interchange protein DsbD